MQPKLLPLSENALLVHWGNRIHPLLNSQVLALYQTLSAMALPEVQDIIPAYSSLTIVLNPDIFEQKYPDANPLRVAQEWINSALNAPKIAQLPEMPTMEIPVCYEDVFAPDLKNLAIKSGLSTDEIAAIHCGQTYRVYMLGFLPGFAYLGAVDARIAAPRLENPRSQVPAGSVGIAGRQTGIYPLESPGGWNLIGRTPLRMFDMHRTEPVLLRPNDQVQFHRISLEMFDQIQKKL